jgi:hypothetical protein
MQMYRQGDVLIERVDQELPENAEVTKPDKLGRLILAEGEATGHAHAVSAAAGALYATQLGLMLQVMEQTKVLHEEHHAIDLDPGLYKITRQREYSPKEIRRVAD